MECAFTSPVRTECGMFVMCYMQCCMSVTAGLRYIDVCNCYVLLMCTLII